MKILKTLKAQALVISAALAMAAPALAETTWRLATVSPPDSPEGLVHQKFADLVEEYSDGELRIIVFPNEQLGKTDAVLEQLERGTVQVYAEGAIFLRKWVEELDWLEAGFLFESRDHWIRFMNTDLVKGWFDEVEERHNVTVLGDNTSVLRGPYRAMVSARTVDSFSDMPGLKLRMYPSDVALRTWTHLGAEVRTLAWTDVYQSLDSGIVEAVTSPIALVESMRFYEVAPHIGRLDEYHQAISYMVNTDALEALSDDERQAVERAWTEAAAYSQEAIGSVAEDSLERMKAQGATFREIDPVPFVHSMVGFYNELETEGQLPEGFLEAVAATR